MQLFMKLWMKFMGCWAKVIPQDNISQEAIAVV